MDHQTTTKRTMRFFSLLVLISLVAALVPAAVQARPAVPTAAAAAGEGAPVQLEVPALLQFTAGGHVLGFGPEAAYLATGSHALRVGFVGANAVQPVGEAGGGASPGGVQPLGRVTYANLWEGITLTYEAVEGGGAGAVAKSTYHLAPGADAGQIRLAYNVPVAVQADGSLRLAFETGEMRESAPVAWQEIEGRRVPVAVAFEVQGQTVGFSLGDYDPRYPLTIDPSYAWHTFYGSDAPDYGSAIAVDGNGSVYVAGSSFPTWQGDGGADPLHPHSGGPDITVLKLNSDGAYQWHTFYGSGDWDMGRAIAVNSSGDVYVSGDSYATWQGDGDADPLHVYSENYDITVLKLGSDGAYQWHTFYGGNDNDFGSAITADSSGHVYVVGESETTWQGDGGTDPLHPYSGSDDITVLKLDSAGAYQWHTFYGSSGNDDAAAIAMDSGGSVYVAGESDTTWQGDDNTDPLHAHSGFEDFAVLKLDSDGAYQWHTFYGSGLTDASSGIVVDSSASVYVGGYSLATWQGDGDTDPLHPHSGNYDITVLRLDGDGIYQWHTFYGSISSDSGRAITMDSGGGVYVTGESWATWQGDSGTDPLHPYSGDEDVTLLKLAGYGEGSWQGDGDADPLHPHSGGYRDITVLKLDNDFYGVTITPPNDAASGDPGSEVVYTLTVTNSGTTTDTFDVSIIGNDWPAAAPLTLGPLEPGVSATLNVTVSVPVDAGCGDFDVVTVTATSQNDASASDSSTLTTSANAAYCLVLEPLTAALNGDPGSDVVYALTLTNTGTNADTFDVSLSGNDWPTVAPPTIGPLGPGVSATLGVTVSVPLTAGCGDFDMVSVTATSQHDASVFDSSTLTTTVNTVYGPIIEPPIAALGGNPGSEVVYTLTVTNSGNAPDTFDVGIASNDWPTVAPLTLGPLGPGLSATLGVTVSIPLGTRGGISDTVILTCTSQNDDAASDSSILTTTANQVAPVLAPIGDQAVILGHTLTFTATASDANDDVLAFSLDAGAPEGATIDPITGAFTWTPSATGVYSATVRVTDDGQPPLDDAETVLITVERDVFYVYLPVVVKNR
jgi:hypothetical protein